MDVNKKIAVEVATELAKKKACEKAYRLNNCHKADVGPALEEFCLEKELCMYIDPKNKVLTTQMIGSFTAEVVNYTITPLSMKTVVILFMGFFAVFIGTNWGINIGTPSLCAGCHKSFLQLQQESLNPSTPTKIIQSCSTNSNSCGGCCKTTHKKGEGLYTADSEMER